MPKRYRSVETVIRRRGHWRLILLSLLAGLCGGLPAVAYRYAFAWADKGRDAVLSLLGTPLSIGLFFLGLLLLGMIVGRITQSEPLISGSGIPQVEGQIMGKIEPRWLPVLLKKFIAGALAMLAGLSLGREGPSIQLGAMATMGMAEKLRCSELEKKYLIGCGGCAGLAAAFNAPLAGVMFGLEEIHKNFSALALFPVMVAALVADLIARAFFGTKSVLGIGLATPFAFRHYVLIILAGVLLGLFASLYNVLLLRLQKGYRRLPLPLWLRITIPFLVAGFVALFCPELLGSGRNIISGLAAGKYLLGALGLLLVGKLAFSLISFCSGAPGGIFFPLLVLGALAGGFMGKLSVLFFGLPESYVMSFVLLGMAGMFAGVVRAPITGIILVVEMSGSLTQLAGITIAACCATLVANLLGTKPIYEALLDNLLKNGPKQQGFSGHHEPDIVTFSVPLDSAMAGRTLRELSLGQGCLVVSVERGSDELLPQADLRLQVGDYLSVAVPPEGRDALMQKLREKLRAPEDA